MQKLELMMKRVGNGVSRSAAGAVGDFWRAVLRADQSESSKVTLSASDYATIYKYAEACAKKAGLI